MFEEILIANRGEQLPTGSAAAQPNCPRLKAVNAISPRR